MFLGREFAPGWFGWLIPGRKHCRVGWLHLWKTTLLPGTILKNGRCVSEIFRAKVLRYTEDPCL